ncbi:hypothetical protein P9139_11760 [Curtobacterium flaccumfaciens]|nr:hypothetical protein P9139_11760 [Curtobacterium flaccumfaciens]
MPIPTRTRRWSSPRVRRAASALAASVAALALVAGCSDTNSTSTSTPSPTKTGYEGAAITGAAEPGTAPEPTTKPAGEVVDPPEGTRPWGVAVAHSVDRVYLAARKQNRFAVYDLESGKVTSADVPGSARMIDLASPGGPCSCRPRTRTSSSRSRCPHSRSPDQHRQDGTRTRPCRSATPSS